MLRWQPFVVTEQGQELALVFFNRAGAVEFLEFPEWVRSYQGAKTEIDKFSEARP
jgi:hypothetical protein